MNQRSWLPRFTIRQMLLLTAGFALFSTILGMAAQGSLVAYGIGFGFLSLLVPAVLGAILYWSVKLISRNRSGLGHSASVGTTDES